MQVARSGQPSPQHASAHHGALTSPQVARNDGTWTYGKIMDYDPSGDVYSVMTKRGPKYFVEKSDITEDVCINPGNGGCAQQ